AGGIIELEGQKTRNDELKSLISRVKKDLKTGIEANEIAVIYRTNKQGIMVARNMLDSKIEFKTNDKLTGIYDHWIYKDILAYYKVAGGKATKWDFELTLNHPQRFLHDKRYRECGPIPSKSQMLQIAESSTQEQWKKDAAKEQIEKYITTLIKIKETKTPEDMIKALLLFGRYKEYLKQYADYRNEDVDELYDTLEEIKASAKQAGSWAAWIEMANLEREELKIAMEGKSGVTLTTMHSAKGLEWKSVYIIDCNDGKNPFVKASSEDDFEEERRLFYVAMTRAKDKLTLMYSNLAGTYELKLSPYIIECGLAQKRASRIDTSIRRSIARVDKETGLNTSTYNLYSDIRTNYADKKENAINIDVSEDSVVESVYHGVGKVKKISEDRISILFSDGLKEFAYPDAFNKSLRVVG
ncbi:MAG: ATP-dependent helicase, partial [Pseudobutyrivibrio sp.]|nr:ATP-dependent helicase [Pseudobutyrivibrio sp.]